MYLPFLGKNYWFQFRLISVALSYMVTSLRTLLCWKLVCSFLLAPTMSVGFIINIMFLYWACLALIFRTAWLLKQLILKDCLPQRDLSLKWLYFIFQTQDLQYWCWNEELHSSRKQENSRERCWEYSFLQSIEHLCSVVALLRTYLCLVVNT